MANRPLLIVFCWAAAIAVAFAVDRPVAESRRAAGFDNKKPWTKSQMRLAEAIKIPGEYGFTLAAAAAFGFFHRRRLYATALILSASALSSVNEVMKRLAGRTRPIKGVDPFGFKPFHLFGENLSFPSGHASLAFAVAAAMGMLLPRGRWAFYALATLVGLERIAENAHYVSDVVVAAALGIACAHFARWLLRRWVTDKPLVAASAPLSPESTPAEPAPARA